MACDVVFGGGCGCARGGGCDAGRRGGSGCGGSGGGGGGVRAGIIGTGASDLSERSRKVWRRSRCGGG